MQFEYLDGEEAGDLALKILHHAIPKGTSNRNILGALGGLAAVVLSDLVDEAGTDALMELLMSWTREIAVKAIMIGKLQEEGFDFKAWAMPTAGEA